MTTPAARPAEPRYWTKPHTIIGAGLALTMPVLLAGTFAFAGVPENWLTLLAGLGAIYFSGFAAGTVIEGAFSHGWQRSAIEAVDVAQRWRDIAQSRKPPRPEATR